MSISNNEDRIFGLDVMRALAILLVVLAHGRDLLGAYIPFQPVVPGVDPVDLFFVLSGYLIGGILLRMSAGPDRTAARIVQRFWMRRWIRTLPNYYLFLILNIILVVAGLIPGVVNHNAFAYFIFLQNVVKPLDLFFWESWSLAVEVWFYTLFPLLLMVLYRSIGLSLRLSYLISVLLLIAVPALLRIPLSEGLQTLWDSDVGIRRMVFTRLDTIAFGALAAWLHAYQPREWERWRWPLFLAGSAFVLLSAMFRSEEHLDYLNTWFFTFTAAGMAAMLPLLAAWRNGGVLRPIVVYVSRVSYALYLTHLPLRYLLIGSFEGLSWSATVLLYLAWWAACFSIAGLVLHFYEQPILDRRDRSRIGPRASV